MNQQNKLGKQIIEARKAKGLTQEELVQQCNISIRTLQRIEAGEVTARNSTIRILFDALDLDFKTYLNENRSLTWSSLISNSVKLNTTYKLYILLTLLIVTGIIVFNWSTEKKQLKSQNQITQTDGVQPAEVQTLNGNIKCTKCFYDNEELIATDVQFSKEGVTVDVDLIKLNTNTGEFNAGFARGSFRSNKVEVTLEDEWIKRELVKFEASGHIEKLNDSFLLYGKAKILSQNNEILMADTIIVQIENNKLDPIDIP